MRKIFMSIILERRQDENFLMECKWHPRRT